MKITHIKGSKMMVITRKDSAELRKKDQIEYERRLARNKNSRGYRCGN
jgi:hypothetical protein